MITDEMLKIAAAEADESICSSLPMPEECMHRFSPEFERKMKRVIRKGRHPAAYKFLQKAACFFLAVMLAGTTWLTVDAEARSAFVSWVKETIDTYVVYRFTGEPNPDSVSKIVCEPEWIPEGYEKSKQQTNGSTSIFLYDNADMQRITFIYSSGADATALFVSSDYESVTDTQVGDVHADYYQAADPDNTNALVWLSENGDTVFCITAPLPESTLVQIAESVKAVETSR